MADCLWADPPIGVRFAGRTRAGSSSANDDAGTSDPVLLGALRIAPLRPNGRFYIGAPAGPGHAAFLSAIEAVGWELQVELVWSMGRLAPGTSDYRIAHQPILYGYAPGPARPGRGRHAGRAWYGDDTQSSVLAFRREAADRDHPRAQPVGLVEQCVGNSTKAGDLVYDPFLGAGTTLIAAERLGRRCLAMEIDPRVRPGGDRALDGVQRRGGGARWLSRPTHVSRGRGGPTGSHASSRCSAPRATSASRRMRPGSSAPPRTSGLPGTRCSRRPGQRAREDALDVLEAEARRRALAGSDGLLMFLLRAHRPERYRETLDLRLELRAEAERIAAKVGRPVEEVLALVEGRVHAIERR